MSENEIEIPGRNKPHISLTATLYSEIEPGLRTHFQFMQQTQPNNYII